MNRRRLGIIAVAAVAAFSCITAVTSTIAWFRGDVSTKDELQGGMKGAYFAGGTGTSTDPYIILHPIHLYNLAWLQYLGYFNRDINGDGALDTFYFKLSDALPNGELDMTGYTLPPIGTERYPFIGNFNGNSKIIKELDVSNDFEDFTKHPSTVTATGTNAFVQPQIVGFFGVIGSLLNPTYTYSSANNRFYDTGLANIDVKTVTKSSLIGVAAGYVNGDISGVALNASGVNIDSSKTELPLSYTGNLSDYGVIGYVAKEGRKKQITRVDETIYDLNISSSPHEFNANDYGTDQGFGGSIDMNALYKRLFALWNSCTHDTSTTQGDTNFAKYPTKATQNIPLGEEDAEIVFGDSNFANASAITGNEGGYFESRYSKDRAYYNLEQKDDGVTTASYGFIVEPGGIEDTGDRDYSTTTEYEKVLDEGRYMCLTGERSIPVDNGADLTTTYYNDREGQFIYYVGEAGTRNYLNFNGSNASPRNVAASDDASCNASLWTYENNAFSTVYLETDVYPPATYYLNCDDSGVLTITTSKSTVWNHDANGYYKTVGNFRYYLGFNGTDWTTTKYYPSAVIETFYLISSGNNYLAHSQAITGAANATSIVFSGSDDQIPDTIKWYRETNYLYALGSDGATRYYLRKNGNSNSVQYNSTSTNYRFSASGWTDGNVRFSTYYYGTYYYLYYNNGWKNRYNSSNVTLTTKTVTHPAGFVEDVHSSSIGLSSSQYRHSSQKSRTSKITSYADTNPTYFPLKEKETRNGNNVTVTPGVPDPYNTGYIVSGAKYRTDPYGDIRVSVFPLFDVDDYYHDDPNALGTSGFTKSSGEIGAVYTINDNGFTETPEETTTYTNSRNYLEKQVLKGSNYVFGLHFMDAQISTDDFPATDNDEKYASQKVGQSVRVGKAVINKETYYNYELPTDCIDFNLKEKGYINFFAGTYYTSGGGNNSFFSLYEIVRDENHDIAQLRKISEIYSDATGGQNSPNSYVYKYDKVYTYKGSTGQYSVPYRFVTINGKTTKVLLNKDANNKDIPYVEHSVQESAESGYNLIFKTKWLEGERDGEGGGSLTNYAAYYFEVAMNDGEYALGSVANKTGAYLMYLDIGANAMKVYRTIASERFEAKEYAMEYPLGIAIFRSPTDISASMKSGDNEHLHLATAKIVAGYTGTVSFKINEGNVNQNQIDITRSVREIAVPNFQGDSIELNIASELVPKTTKDIMRVEYYDYNVNTLETTHVVITFTSTDGGSNYARDIKCYDADGNEILESENWKIYRTFNGKKFASVDDITYENLTKSSEDGLYYTAAANTSLFKARYWETSTVTGESAYVLHLEKTTDANGKVLYVFKDYTFMVTVTNGTLEVEVLALGSRKIIVGGVTNPGIGTKITLPVQQ